MTERRPENPRGSYSPCADRSDFLELFGAFLFQDKK